LRNLDTIALVPSSCLEEEFLAELISCVESQVMAAGVLLAIEVDLLSSR
jgi:hypothetical protein